MGHTKLMHINFSLSVNVTWYTPIQPAREIMALFVLQKLIFQMHMRSHPVGLDVWFLVGSFVYFHTSCVRTATAQEGCLCDKYHNLMCWLICLSGNVTWYTPIKYTSTPSGAYQARPYSVNLVLQEIKPHFLVNSYSPFMITVSAISSALCPEIIYYYVSINKFLWEV